jgi:hypothetical protein
MGVTDLTAKEIAKYRDHRLKEASPASLKRELVILRRVFNPSRQRLGHCPASESCKDDYLA